MTKKILIIASLLIFSIASFSQGVIGTWKTIDDNTGKARSHIKIFKGKNGLIYGQITKITDPAKQDKKCTECKGKKKNQPIMGLLLVEGMKKDGDEYSGGTITDPDSGKVYTCKLWLDGKDLKVRGYIGWFFRTQTWKRVS